MNKPEPEQVNKPKKTGRRTAYLLFGVGAVPVLLAFFMYFSGTLVPEGRTNKGMLILPPLDIMDWALSTDAEAGSEDNKWRLIVVGDGPCLQRCQDALFTVRQVNTALGREATRVEHAYVELNQDLAPELAQLIKQEHPRLRVLFADKLKVMFSIDQQLNGSDALQNTYIFIADPLGNIMMYYTSDHVGRDILDDMKKLLKVSKIG